MDLLKTYSNGIASVSSTMIKGYVLTDAQFVVDSIEFTMYFQREVSGNWSTIATRSATVYTTDQQTKTEYLTITTGYNYRIRTIHTARDNGDVESRTITSSTISM